MAVIKTYAYTPDKALTHLSTCRAFVHPNPGYAEQLDLYAETHCNVMEANAQWTKRKVEIARANGIARSSPLAFVKGAGPRISGWFRRKIKRPVDENRHEKMKVVEADGL